MKRFILFNIASCFVLLSVAQTNSGSNDLAISLGASVTYYYGPGDRNFGKFEDDRVNWKINAMLGYVLVSNKEGKQTILSAFGNYGLNNAKTLNHIFSDQGYTSTAVSQSSVNNYFQLEGGVVIAEILRLSTGVGQQNFDSQTLTRGTATLTDAKSLKYNSSTIGFQFSLGKAKWVIDCNFAYGQDFEKTVINPSTGLLFRF
jgi:hypothetical protein